MQRSNTMTEFRYEHMYPDEFAAAVEKLPVFIVPTGLLEWHGDHLPLGLDTLKVYGICLEVARKLGGGIVLPPNYYGTPGFSTYLGTLTYSEQTLRPLFLELFGQLKKAGAKVIALITGHYGKTQVDFIHAVGAEFAAANPGVHIIARPEYEGVTVNGESPSDHAGKWETSMFLALHPDKVRWGSYRQRITDMKTYPDAPLDYHKETADWTFREDLRKTSSAELGRQAVEAISDAFAADIRNALTGRGFSSP